MPKERKTLSNCVLIFETEHDMTEVWKAITKGGYMDISYNYFAIMKPNWKTKIIKWILRV